MGYRSGITCEQLGAPVPQDHTEVVAGSPRNASGSTNTKPDSAPPGVPAPGQRWGCGITMDDEAAVRVERGRAALRALEGVLRDPLRAGVPQVLPKLGNKFRQAAGLVHGRLGVRAHGRRNLPGGGQHVAQCVDLDLGGQTEMVQRRPKRLQKDCIAPFVMGQKADVAPAAGRGEGAQARAPGSVMSSARAWHLPGS